MDLREILCDDIDAVVFGDSCEEFFMRMFKTNPSAFIVNSLGDIKQLTQIISTAHLFLHFNFYFIPENLFAETIEVLKKDIYLGIVTCLLDDIMSYEKSGELYDKYIQDSTVPLKNFPGRLGFAKNSILPEELALINLWHPQENHQIIPAGIKAAVCSKRKAKILIKENRDGVLKNVRFITNSTNPELLEEKHSIFLWMFENYVKKNKKMNIPSQLSTELKEHLVKNSSSCVIF